MCHPLQDPGSTPYSNPLMFLLKNIWLFTLYVCDLSHCSRVRLFATLWTVASQAPQSMRLSSQEYWNGLQYPSPGGLLDPGVKPAFLKSPMLVGRFLYRLHHLGRPTIYAEVKWKLLSPVRLFATPWTEAPRFLCPWDSPGKSNGVSYHFLLQAIFLTQRMNSGPLTAERFFTVWATIKRLQLRLHPMIGQNLPSEEVQVRF